MVRESRVGMRAGNTERLKRRMLRQAVAENLDMIRGVPPRALRPANRVLRLWARRISFVVVPLSLLGSTYWVANETRSSEPPTLAKAAMPAVAKASTLPALRAPEAVAGSERLAATAFPLSVKRVVLDAGHGGTDPGTIALDLHEKAITLDIGARLRTLLEADGYEVVMTRDADRTIALRDRAVLANSSKSDIFVSIHVNAIVKHTESRGVETYYLGATDDPSLTKLAAVENRVSGYSMTDMRKLLDGVYADARRDESRELAAAVQRNLYTSLSQHDTGLENWGVKRAPFIVLVATDMPAILAEVGCISNEKEAALLRRPDYRQKIADALFSGIRAYAKGSERNG
jgi:N-acetylmuramoyl-L-alanine amidase